MYSIHLYAEVLLNIKSVSLFGNVVGDEEKESVARLFVENRSLRLKHGDDEIVIKLPCRLPGQNPASFNLPAVHDKEFSLRVSPDKELYTLTEASSDQINHAPWEASTFSPNAALHCASCEMVVVPSQSIKRWKNLPSENWAEMMDFWHCHKPDVPNDNITSTEAPAKKGYAASNTFLASESVCLVSISDFILARDDVHHLSEHNIPKMSSISECNMLCTNCSAPLGSTDENARGVRLLKSSLQLIPAPGRPMTQVPAQKWVAEHLLNLIETQAARKFLVRPKPSEDYVIWVFTPDYLFCSVTTKTKSAQYSHPTRAMKVLSKRISSEDADMLDTDQSPTATIEDLNLPIHLHETLVHTLRENALSIPTSARLWGEWEVSFLRRFTAKELTCIPDN